MPSDTINVVVRAKPLLTTSKSIPWIIQDNSIYERNTTPGECFTFDKVFDVDQKNEDIYETIISPMVHSAIEGINLTIFAYGATSSGKTYTMNGNSNDPGVIPRIIEEIFNEIQMCSTRKFLVRVSYVEIYREIINDLLDKNNKDLKIREDLNNFINYNPTEKIIKSCKDCLNIMKIGTANRTTGETLMNSSSSRSHSIFRIIIESTPTSGDEQDPVQVSQVNLIDLAGSERVSQTGATGERFKEGAHINKSLTVLGLVIRQLVEKKEYISYRDSKLTRILSNSLGGNAETVIICNINLLSLEDTQSTLLFAQRAKAVKVKPKVTVITNESSLTKKYAKECADLKILLDKELEKNKQLEQQSVMSNREILDLTSRIQNMQEIFVKREPVKKPPKRRHTFCSVLNSISEEKEIDPTCRNSGFAEEFSDLRSSIDCEKSFNTIPEELINSKEETPVKVLRERIKILGNEYDELLEFTRLEESTQNSVEEDMAQKISMLSMANSELRSSLENAETQIQKLLLENEKSQQSVNDYEYLVESQKKRYQKRVNELIQQIDEWNSSKIIPLQTPQINTFEYEEMIDNIESLKKQNEKLHELVDSANTHNANAKYLEEKNKQLLEENRALELANSEFQSKLSSYQSENIKLNHTINAQSLQVSQLKIRNQSLLTKYSGLENQNNLLSCNLSNVSSLEKQISELKEQVCALKSELEEANVQLDESLDKNLELSQDLDAEERKSSELQKQLEIEKRKRIEAEIKLDQIEHSSDALIYQKCKSLDSSVLHMLKQLQLILDPNPNICDTNVSSTSILNDSMLSNFMVAPSRNEISTSYNSISVSDSTKNFLNVDLEKLQSFSSCSLEDTAGNEKFMSYCESVFNENSIQSDDEDVSTRKTTKIVTEPYKTDTELSIEMLKNEVSTMKIENQSNITKSGKLQKQIDDYNYSNLSDAEKIEKTNESNSSTMSTLEMLQTEEKNSSLGTEKRDVLAITEIFKNILKLRYEEPNQNTWNIREETSDTETNLLSLSEQICQYIKKLEEENTNFLQLIKKIEIEKLLSDNMLEAETSILLPLIKYRDEKDLKCPSAHSVKPNIHELVERIQIGRTIEEITSRNQIVQSDGGILKKPNKNFNIMNSVRKDQFLDLHSDLKKNSEDNENFEVFENEQEKCTQSAVNAENYQNVMQQLYLELERLQSELHILRDTNKELNKLNSEKDDQLLQLRAELKKNIESYENFKVWFEKEQDISSHVSGAENDPDLIKKLKSDKLEFEKVQLEVDILKKTHKDLNIQNSEKDNKLHELRTMLEDLKVLSEREQNKCKQNELEIENYKQLIQKLTSEKQEYESLKLEMNILKTVNKGLENLNSEKDDQLLTLGTELKKNIESKENFENLFQKEHDKREQAEVEIENYQKLIQRLKSENEEIHKIQLEMDSLKKTNKVLSDLNSEKDNQLLELRAILKNNVESKESFQELYEREHDECKLAGLQIENLQKLIEKLKLENQELVKIQLEMESLKKTNNVLNDLNSEKDNQLLELRETFKKNVESKENFQELYERERNKCKQARLQIEHSQRLIESLKLENQELVKIQLELDSLRKTNNGLNDLNSKKDKELLNLRETLTRTLETKDILQEFYEREHIKCKLVVLQMEHYENSIEKLKLENQELVKIQLEIESLKKTNNDLSDMNSEKDNQLLELRETLKKYVESKESFQELYEKEHDKCKLTEIQIENSQNLIEKLKLENQELIKIQLEMDSLKKTNKVLNDLNSEKDNQFVELSEQLRKNVENQENLRVLFEEEQDKCKKAIIEIEKSQRLILQLKSRKQECDNIQSEVDSIKNMNRDLNIHNCENDDMTSKESSRFINEKEHVQCTKARSEVESYQHLRHNVEAEKQELLESSQNTIQELLSQVDCLNKKNAELLADIEEKENQFVTLNSKLQEIVSEKENNLKLIDEFENENIKLKEEKNTLLQRLSIAQNKSSVQVTIGNVQESTDSRIDQLFSEIMKLKEILPRDESSHHLQEFLLYNRPCWNYNSKLHNIKLLIDKVNLIVEERNLLKRQNNVGYKNLLHEYENMKKELEKKKGECDSLIADLKTSENECQKLRDKNDTYRSEVEQLNSSLTKMQAKQLNYVSQLENLTFENQNLAQKVKDMEKLRLSYKKIEQKLQCSVDENKALTAKLNTNNKGAIHYEMHEENSKKIEVDNSNLIKYRINEHKNQHLMMGLPADDKTKELDHRILRDSIRNDEFVERKEFEILKSKYEQLKQILQASDQRDSEIEATITHRKENKWKQQRTETHDSRRSIDLNTLCSESVVDTCNSCGHMQSQLQRTKLEVLELRKYIETTSSSEFEKLKGKYEILKKLCRTRNDEISKLKQSLVGKEQSLNKNC